MDNLILFVDDKIPRLLDLFSHDGVHLGKLLAGLTALQRMGHIITEFIKFCGLSALSGDNQRRTGLVDQDGVNLINDRIMQISLHQLVFIDDHIIPQIVKAQLVVGDISDIAGIGRPALLLGGTV